MRIVAFSDSHGSVGNVFELFEKTAHHTDLYLFAGDGLADVDSALTIYKKPVIRVAGNNDYFANEPATRVFEEQGVKFLLTHGNQHGVSYGNEGLKRVAVQNGCQVVVFGHTHCRSLNFENGVWYLNPGSIAKPRDYRPTGYATIDLTPQKIDIRLCDL